MTGELDHMDQGELKTNEISFIIFDLDGVLADTISSWVFLHEHYGVNNDVSFYAYMNNEIDDHEFMRRDIKLWLDIEKKLHINKVKELLDSVPLMPGFHATMKSLKSKGIETAIVSAGLEQLANRVAETGGIKYVLANGLELDPEGYLTGEGILRVKLCDKGSVVNNLISELGLAPDNVMAIGNGEIDIPMFKAARIGIAFNPHDEKITESADVVIHEKDLTKILNYI
jgi:phosphoserine phosphatase